MSSVYSYIYKYISRSRTITSSIKAINYLTRSNKEKNLSFIFGCQRSGTTVLLKVLDKSINAKAYGEGEEPYFHPKSSKLRLRLVSNKDITRLLDKERCQNIILKPLYESQRATELAGHFEQSRILWTYRNFNDSIDSHVRYYAKQDAVEYVRQIVGRERMWMNENIDREHLDELTPIINGLDNPYDAYAVYWYSRNLQFKKLDGNPRVMPVKYERLVNDPVAYLPKIFRFLDLKFSEWMATGIYTDAVNKRIDFQLRDDIKTKCEQLQAYLDSHESRKQNN
ncbi:MAG: sulfotransferase [Candidatus Thiodiazotropha sp.]